MNTTNANAVSQSRIHWIDNLPTGIIVAYIYSLKWKAGPEIGSTFGRHQGCIDDKCDE
jgi:hypothetical protein